MPFNFKNLIPESFELPRFNVGPIMRSSFNFVDVNPDQQGTRTLESARDLGQSIRDKFKPVVETALDKGKRFGKILLEPGAEVVEPSLKSLGVSPAISAVAGFASDFLAPGPGEFKKLEKVKDIKVVTNFLKKQSSNIRRSFTSKVGFDRAEGLNRIKVNEDIIKRVEKNGVDSLNSKDIQLINENGFDISEILSKKRNLNLFDR